MSTRSKKIVLVTGEYVPSIGGPAIYTHHLYKELVARRHQVKVVTYGLWQKKLPTGLRHIVFTCKLFWQSFFYDHIWAFDTYSVGLPATVISILLRKKLIVRIGGDFLWEHFVNRTEKKIFLSEFYTSHDVTLNLKEKIIFYFTKQVVRHASHIVFSTVWQRDIWVKSYGIDKTKTTVIENACAFTQENTNSHPGLFVSPSRQSAVKNKGVLRNAITIAQNEFPDISLDESNLSHTEHLVRMRNAYVVVIPSVSEVSPNLLLDGLMFAKPFILTKDCGYAERYAKCGVLIDPRNVEELINAIHTMLDEKKYAGFKEEILKLSFARTYTDVADDFLKLAKYE